MSPVPLPEAGDESEFGGKAASLAQALQSDLPVPPGFALSCRTVDRIVSGDAEALDQLAAAFSRLRAPVAARSSALGEDSERASFAGQHLTVLNVTNFEQLTEAIGRVVESVSECGGEAYREKLGFQGAGRMGVVVQELLNPDTSGVLFTKNPLTGARERVIEAAWGLGEVVVSGLVIPDHYRLDVSGTMLECRIGEKDLILRIRPDGGTEEVEVEPARRDARVMNDEGLHALHELACRCEAVYGPDLDIEWCILDGVMYLLQCRAITAAG